MDISKKEFYKKYSHYFPNGINLENLKEYINPDFLKKAIEDDNLELVKDLISINKNLINERDENGETSLQIACHHSNTKIAKELLKPNSGIEIDQHYMFGDRNPLYWAVSNNNIELVLLLLNYGTENPEVIQNPDLNGETSLHLACRNNNIDIVELLLKYKFKHLKDIANDTPIDIACQNENIPIIETLNDHFKLDFKYNKYDFSEYQLYLKEMFEW